MAQHRDVVAARHAVLVGGEEAAERGLHAEQREEPRRHDRDAHLLRGAVMGEEEEAAGAMGRQVPDGRGAVAYVRKVGVRNPLRRRRVSPDRRDDHELFRTVRGDGPQHEGVGEGKDGGDRAHGEGERDERGDREPGAAGERAQTVAQVLEHRLEATADLSCCPGRRGCRAPSGRSSSARAA